MAIWLVDDDLDLSIELRLEPQLLAALQVQMQRSSSGGAICPFEARFIKNLLEFIDADLRPPTWRQVAYAIDIAKSLDVSLPGEALRFKGSMSEFLERYAPIFKEKAKK